MNNSEKKFIYSLMEGLNCSILSLSKAEESKQFELQSDAYFRDAKDMIDNESVTDSGEVND